jgi:hypothetical protein
LRGWDQEDPREKVSKISILISWVWWHVPEILAMPEALGRRLIV